MAAGGARPPPPATPRRPGCGPGQSAAACSRRGTRTCTCTCCGCSGSRCTRSACASRMQSKSRPVGAAVLQKRFCAAGRRGGGGGGGGGGRGGGPPPWTEHVGPAPRVVAAAVSARSPWHGRRRLWQGMALFIELRQMPARLRRGVPPHDLCRRAFQLWPGPHGPLARPALLRTSPACAGAPCGVHGCRTLVVRRHSLASFGRFVAICRLFGAHAA